MKKKKEVSMSRQRSHRHRRSNNNSFSNAGGQQAQSSHPRGNRNGNRIKYFDPTSVILQSQTETQQIVENDVYENRNNFVDFEISPELKRNIADRGYKTPTPIQDQVIPHILKGKDVVGIANTGTGKTAAFLIPLIEKIIQNPEEKVLIIAPTRELAVQIRDELKLFITGINIYSTLTIGGTSLNRQIEHLKRGQSFVIGTPGRIKDLNERRKLPFDQFGTIVLDEVDRMLDMGFIHDIKRIISLLPAVRTSLFFSATMTPIVQEVMNDFLHDPIFVSVKTQETSTNVIQNVIKMNGRSKLDVLHELLQGDSFEKVLVFHRTKHAANKLAQKLTQRGIKANAIHGNKSQNQRQRALDEFKKNYVKVLIATDVVARGVDIKNVTHVINYDFPESYESYVHRIGRTGRADSKGVALTFVE